MVLDLLHSKRVICITVGQGRLKFISNMQCTCHELIRMLLLYRFASNQQKFYAYLQHVSETFLLKLSPLKVSHYITIIQYRQLIGMANFLYEKHRICRRSGLCRFYEFHRDWSMGGTWTWTLVHVKSLHIYLPLTAATVTSGKVSVLHSNLSKSLKKLILSASVKLSNSWRSSPREKCLSFPIVTIAVASWQLQHLWHTVIMKNLDEGCTLVKWRNAINALMIVPTLIIIIY